MPSRDLGSRPAASSGSSASAASSAITASRIRRWISKSDGIGRSQGKGALRRGIGSRGLRQNDVERGHVIVPLDQSRLWPEALKRAGVERPDRLGDPAAMGVDQDFAAAVLQLRRKAPQMQLRDGVYRKLGDIAIALEAEVVCAEIDVAHVAQKAAAGAPDELGQKLDLRHGRSAESHIARWVLDQILPPKRVLHFVNMCADDAQRFLGVRQRQEVVEVLARVGRPGEVARYEDRIDPIDQRPDAGKVRPVYPARAANRDANRVNRDWIVARDVDEQLGSMRIGQEVLWMDLEPRRGRAGGHDIGKVREPQAHARRSRYCTSTG